MPEKTAPRTESAAEATTALPEPIEPKDGALVDARAVPFEWSAADPGAEYVLQVASSPEFDEIIATISTGETTAATIYHTLDRFADQDLYWRAGLGKKGPWGSTASFHAAGVERLGAELTARDRAARETAQKALQRHLEGEHRMPVVLPEDESTDRHTAVVIGVIVVSFIILLIILFLVGQITYPAEAVV